MSLLDALLLEPAPLKTPGASEFFVALRSDGVLGSGTAADPFDGNVVEGPSLTAALELVPELSVGLDMTVAGSVITLTVNSSPDPHGCSVWDFVTIKDADPSACDGNYRVTKIVSEHVFECIRNGSAESDSGTGTCQPAIVLATVTAGHGLVDYDLVTIAGVTQGGNPSKYYNGTFVIYSVTTTTFLVRIAAPPSDPEGSSITCRKVVYRFDLALDALPKEPDPTAATLHIGPGVFETRGPNGGWLDTDGFRQDAYFVRPGQKFIGSGIGITTLKVVVTEVPIEQVGYIALGPNDYDQYADGAEVSDLTVDCNLAAHPYGGPYSKLSKGGVILLGSHVRLRRVRIIDFGTQTPNAECFPLSVGGHHPFLPEVVNAVIEECIVERPSPNNVRETTCLGIGGGNAGGVSSYSRGCVIRNCVLDLRYEGLYSSHYLRITGFEAVTSPSAPANTYRVTTDRPHHFGNMNKLNVVIGGIWAPVHPTASATLNGSFSLRPESVSWESPYTFEYTASGPAEPVIDWWNSGVVGVQFHGPGADVVERNRVFHLWLGANHDTHSSKDTIYRLNYYSNVWAGPFHGINGLNYAAMSGSAISHDGPIARFTSFAPHGLETGNHVDVNDALVNNSNVNRYNLSDVEITKVDDYTFTYDADIPELIPGTDVPYPNASAAPLFRKQGEGWQLGVSVTRSELNPLIAIFTAAATHGLSIGDHLEISAVTVNGDANTPYNGQYSDGAPDLYKVTAVSGLTFEYEMSANPGGVAPYYTPWFRLHGNPNATRVAGTCLIRNGTVALFTSFYPHGLLQGQVVFVRRARDLGVSPNPEINPFNGYFEIESVPASPNIDGKPTTFTYRMAGVPTTNAAGVPDSSEFWRVRQLAIERNIIEIASVPCGAIQVGGAENPRVYRRLAVEENVVRPFDGLANPNAYAINAVSVQQAVIANNIVSGLTRTDGRIIWDQSSDRIGCIGNQRTDGPALRSFDQTAGHPRDDLRSKIEDSLLMAL